MFIELNSIKVQKDQGLSQLRIPSNRNQKNSGEFGELTAFKASKKLAKIYLQLEMQP
jgi:hypothetical protein